MKTTFALLTLAAVSLVAAPPQTPPAESTPASPATTQPKKAKHHRNRKAGAPKTQNQKQNAPKN